ncbi:MAG: NAD(P)H-dependent oxidoreductase subunit E [Evtepia sp.]
MGIYQIMLCDGTACHVNGSDRIRAAITQELGIHNGETTEDGMFTLNEVACLGCCSLAPVMMIERRHLWEPHPRKDHQHPASAAPAQSPARASASWSDRAAAVCLPVPAGWPRSWPVT